MANAKSHDYHLVDPSPWPLMMSASVFVLALGCVFWLHEMVGIWLSVIGLGGVLATFTAWWMDIVKEAHHDGHHTPVVQLHLRYGMLLFIASEVMFFVAWFWAFFDASLFTDETINYLRHEFTGAIWPPKEIHVFDPWSLPLLNTLILLLSGTTITWAHHALLNNDRKSLSRGLLLTIGLGALFTVLQVVEYAEAAFSFSGNIYGAVFFMATGFHGFHVIVGTIFLFICWLRVQNGHFTPKHHFGFEAAAWYWHFVDVVWLFLFAAVYVWGNSGGIIASH